jgi:hypothetical protein
MDVHGEDAMPAPPIVLLFHRPNVQ